MLDNVRKYGIIELTDNKKAKREGVGNMWRDKANKIIGDLCYESYRKTNFKPNGKRKSKKHIPYSIPIMAEELLDCLKRDDEIRAKQIFMRLHFVPESVND